WPGPAVAPAPLLRSQPSALRSQRRVHCRLSQPARVDIPRIHLWRVVRDLTDRPCWLSSPASWPHDDRAHSADHLHGSWSRRTASLRPGSDLVTQRRHESDHLDRGADCRAGLERRVVACRVPPAPKSRNHQPMTPGAGMGAVALLAGVVSGCAVSGPVTCRTGEKQLVAETLYLGAAMRDGLVGDAEWTRFLDDWVTPRFPDGLTVLQASGQWRGANGRIVEEPSRVLYLVHPGDEASERKVEEIASEYKRRFEQEAVLR